MYRCRTIRQVWGGCIQVYKMGVRQKKMVLYAWSWKVYTLHYITYSESLGYFTRVAYNLD